MRSLFRYIRNLGQNYERLIEITLSKENLLHNLHAFQKDNPGAMIAPVLKSNAYGHNLVQIAKMLEGENVAFLVVDSYYEALVLRKEGIRSKILVIGFTIPKNVYRSRLKNVSFTITSMQELEELSRELKSPTKFHLKIDTGMHRQGILTELIPQAVALIKANKSIILEGVCSHFADADGTDEAFTKKQILAWQNTTEILKKEFSSISELHLSNTAGTFYKNIDANIIRLGLGLYGIKGDAKNNLELRPVLEMSSIISGIKKIEKGDSVGYNATFTAQNDISVATVPAGYADGIDRRLSESGFFKIKDSFAPIIGKVSMNITSISLEEIPNAKTGDQVIMISRVREDKNSIENISTACKTTPYEILVHIAPHIRRRVI